MYIADGSNMKIHVFDRLSLKELYSFGRGGRQPGEFYAVHNIVSDSKGDIFTTGTYHGRRVRKFVYKGRAAIPIPHYSKPFLFNTSGRQPFCVSR
jgi:hypothetical protein